MDKLIIRTLHGIEAAVGEAIDRDNVEYGNIIRQYFIQPEKQVEIPFLFNISMKKELACMNLSIRTSATNNIDRDF